jgi:hypothetical protein
MKRFRLLFLVAAVKVEPRGGHHEAAVSLVIETPCLPGSLFAISQATRKGGVMSDEKNPKDISYQAQQKPGGNPPGGGQRPGGGGGQQRPGGPQQPGGGGGQQKPGGNPPGGGQRPGGGGGGGQKPGGGGRP